MVGELDGSVQATKDLIESTFGGVPAPRELEDVEEAVEAGQVAPAAAQARAELPDDAPLPLRQRHPIRPPVR